MEWFEHIVVIFSIGCIYGLLLMTIPAIEFANDEKRRLFSYKVIWIIILLFLVGAIFDNWDKIFRT